MHPRISSEPFPESTSSSLLGVELPTASASVPSSIGSSSSSTSSVAIAHPHTGAATIISSSSTSLPGVLGFQDTTPNSGDNTTSNIMSSPSSIPLTVKFAPLPELAPRKRRSTVPLGMAARAQLVRRRRAMMGMDPDGYEVDQGQMIDGVSASNALWTPEEIQRSGGRIVVKYQSDEGHDRLANGKGKSSGSGSVGGGGGGGRTPRRRKQPMDGGYPGDEDPFVSLGKMVKGAGKQLWRKVSQTQTQEEEKEKEGKKKKKQEKALTSSNTKANAGGHPEPPAVEGDAGGAGESNEFRESEESGNGNVSSSKTSSSSSESSSTTTGTPATEEEEEEDSGMLPPLPTPIALSTSASSSSSSSGATPKGGWVKRPSTSSHTSSIVKPEDVNDWEKEVEERFPLTSRIVNGVRSERGRFGSVGSVGGRPSTAPAKVQVQVQEEGGGI
ncbi:hypothetical protein BDN72DRAFT_855257 [Pluteus cervinus]|uniref:Uncharacterized protein n=1 Tax=Pluteus cervinus TaxID=181527 RepID=A0ACD3B338_9AGAR|nr:hypothetical protein BDN72DRAFT_855257 [Pluteus cervinus]